MRYLFSVALTVAVISAQKAPAAKAQPAKKAASDFSPDSPLMQIDKEGEGLHLAK